ncbi:MAG: TIGR01777 family oxidoreductase [Acidobacteriaceae bacterium]
MSEKKKRILISGASGLIGSAMRRALQERGMDVATLVRHHREVVGGTVYWNPSKPDGAIHPMGVEGFDAVLHFSGANVARRWTDNYRREIVVSRVGSTRALCEALAQVRQPPRVLVCASATGIYGNRSDEVLTETSAPGKGFLAETCLAWEQAAEKARAAGIRVVHARFGVVLSRKGGALKKMLPPFRLGLGGKLGSGQQWMSWIGMRDAVQALLFLMEADGLAGPFNLTAPQPVTNAEFTRMLGSAVHRPAWLGVPAGLLRVAFGAAMANEMLLASERVLPQRLEEAGFRFEDEELGTALRGLLG